MFDLQVTKFLVNWPFCSGEEFKIYFQDGDGSGQLGYPIGTSLDIFIYLLP